MSFTLSAKWTDDSQGKKDFDGDIVGISTRYHPPGYGMGGHPTPLDDPHTAESTLVLYYGDEHGDEDVVEIARASFEAPTFEEVQRKVEEWAAERFQEIIRLLQGFYGHPTT